MSTPLPALKDAFLIPRSLIVTRHQPRASFDVSELRESIKEHGILQPLVVTDGAITKEGEQGFWLIAGERRLRASEGMLFDLPCILRRGKDAQAAAMETLVENVQREDLTPLEEAASINEVMLQQELSPQRMAAKLGKSRKYVAERVALLTRGADVKAMVEQNPKTFSIAATIDKVKEPEFRQHLIEEAISGTPSRAIESQVEVWKDEKKRQKKGNSTTAPDAETAQRHRQAESGQTASVSRGLILQGATATHASQKEAQKEITAALIEAQGRLMHARSWLAALPSSEQSKFAGQVSALALAIEGLKKTTGLEN